MKNILTILKKELKRFFTDYRMLLTLFLPGIIIYVMYSFMGDFLTSSMEVDPTYKYSVYVSNMPEKYNVLLESEQFDISTVDTTSTLDEAKQKIQDKEFQLAVVFDDDFENKVAQGLKPSVQIYYNSSSTESLYIYQYFYQILSADGTEVTYDFEVNMQQGVNYDLATKEDTSIMVITMIAPYLLVMFLFSGCMALSSESIAGEKERGTIASLLVTPVDRKEIATGKVLALSITSLASAVVSFLGLIASLPKLMGAQGDVTIDMYKADTYLSIFVIIILTVILFTVILSIISTLSKSVKEAAQYSSLVMILVVLMGLTSMTGVEGIASNAFLYFIPIYNSVQMLSGIFALNLSMVNFAITIVANVVYIAAGIFLLSRMFQSEKIMFNK